jgi:hypothetical protein
LKEQSFVGIVELNLKHLKRNLQLKNERAESDQNDQNDQSDQSDQLNHYNRQNHYGKLLKIILY